MGMGMGMCVDTGGYQGPARNHLEAPQKCKQRAKPALLLGGLHVAQRRCVMAGPPSGLTQPPISFRALLLASATSVSS